MLYYVILYYIILYYITVYYPGAHSEAHLRGPRLPPPELRGGRAAPGPGPRRAVEWLKSDEERNVTKHNTVNIKGKYDRI